LNPPGVGESTAEAATENGHPAAVVSSAGALVRALHAISARRIVMVTPYTRPPTAEVRAYLEAKASTHSMRSDSKSMTTQAVGPARHLRAAGRRPPARTKEAEAIVL
jgi:maleate cis-trans isomerase